ncbi:hypothetical protein AJ79_00231 [Helicocarpus griseus UAMH5409]|uniref:Uncharacterized protein n=1 Tax=Helicocarpus griseus UAMH5409 TaxID=1447875 RepID=A0A2B7YD35_9EURO|nr:hypothetical protein AJ79_00231 [Helicocarpus griseus UAMH5409]
MPPPPLPPVKEATGKPSQDAMPKDPRKFKSDPQFDPARALQEFASHVASTVNLTGERSRLAKRAQSESIALQKASIRGFQYPSIAKRLKTGKEQLDNELARVDEKLQTHEKIRDDMIKQLAAHFNSGQKQAQSHSELEEVRGDARQTKADIRDLRKELAKALGDIMNTLENRIADQLKSAALSAKAREDSSREQLQETCKKLVNERADLSLQRLEDVERTFHRLQGTCDMLKDRMNSWHQELEKMQHSIVQLQTTFNTFKDEKTNPTPEPHQPTLNGSSASADSLADIMRQLENIRQLQESKDEALADDLEKYEAKLATLEQGISKLQQVAEKKEMSVQAIGNGKPSTLQVSPELLELRQGLFVADKNIKNQFQMIHAHQTALQSLETRYNHLTTEQLVQRMVVAMQEMYPHASTVQHELPGIKESIKSLSTSVNALHAQLRTSDEARTAMVSDLSAEKARMDDAINSLGLRMNENEKDLKTKMDHLKEKLKQDMEDVQNEVVQRVAPLLLDYQERTKSEES